MSYPTIGYKCPTCTVNGPKVYPAVAYQPSPEKARDEELHGKCVICGETDPKVTYHNICLCCAQGLNIDDWYGWRILKRKWTLREKEEALKACEIKEQTKPDITYQPQTERRRIKPTKHQMAINIVRALYRSEIKLGPDGKPTQAGALKKYNQMMRRSEEELRESNKLAVRIISDLIAKGVIKPDIPGIYQPQTEPTTHLDQCLLYYSHNEVTTKARALGLSTEGGKRAICERLIAAGEPLPVEPAEPTEPVAEPTEPGAGVVAVGEFEIVGEPLAKIAKPGKGYKPDIDRPVLVHRAIEAGVMTDGFLLVEDKKATEEVIGKFLEREKKKEIARLVKAELSEPDAIKAVEQEYAEYAKEGTFPEYKQLYPESFESELTLIGTEPPNDRLYPTAYLSDGEHIVPVHADKLAFMLKYLPGAKMMYSAKARPITFVVEGENKGLLMPLFMEEIPPEVKEAATRLVALKPNITYEPQTGKPRLGRARILWTRESNDERTAILKALALPEPEKWFAWPWNKLPENYRMAIAAYYDARIKPEMEELLPAVEGEPDMELLPTTGPIILTQEEYRKTWKPKGWELLVIGPTSTWRQEWGAWEAIRDIVQNCLDETEGYRWYYDDLGLCIEDSGSGIAVADFLLGPPKPKPPWARGRFGEGMKIAALALLRMGYLVKIETVGKEVWVIFLKVKVNGEAEQLAALWRKGRRERGTVFRIMGYKGPAFEDRFAVNIPRDRILHEGLSQLDEPEKRYNQLIWNPPGAPGMIYCRDIYLRDIDSPFSYNLWSFELAPDRHGPADETEMWRDAGRLWATCDKVELLEQFLRMVTTDPADTDEGRFISMNWMERDAWGKHYNIYTEENAEAWRTAWSRVMGDAVIRTDDRRDGVVKHLGYTSTFVQSNVRGALGMILKTDKLLIQESQESLRGVQVIPDDELTETALVHIGLARQIAKSWPAIKGVHPAIIPPASDIRRTAGLYNTTTQEVFISLDQLERAWTTVDTTIHEIAHFTSGAEDGDEAHNEAMTSVGSWVVKCAAEGYYDRQLEGAKW